MEDEVKEIIERRVVRHQRALAGLIQVRDHGKWPDGYANMAINTLAQCYKRSLLLLWRMGWIRKYLAGQAKWGDRRIGSHEAFLEIRDIVSNELADKMKQYVSEPRMIRLGPAGWMEREFDKTLRAIDALPKRPKGKEARVVKLLMNTLLEDTKDLNRLEDRWNSPDGK